MPDILALLHCLQPCLTMTSVRQLSRITLALLTMTGRVTMLGISRWGDDGTSYRTIQRFFATPLPWHLIFWHIFSAHHFQPNHVYILAGDEVVITKAGKKTFGLDRFFSGILQRVVPSVAFFSFALVSTTSRRAFPLCLEQVVRTEAEKAAAKVKAAKTATQTSPKPKAGRPKGSKNKPKTDTHSLSCELQRIQCILQDQLALIVGTVPLTYLALDGHFGTAPAIQMVRGCGLHLISKLRSNAALFLPYDGPYQGRGPHRKYGEKLDIKALPARFLRERHVEDGVETCIYQVEALQKEVSQPLNVVVVVKLNLKTQKRAHVVLFSSDVTLSVEKVIEYYSLRFQIEFTFRDAKQYWGLEDFMNVTARGVENAANLSLLMVSLSAVLLREARESDAQCSVLDLKAAYRGTKYVSETIKLLPEKLDEGLIAHIVCQVALLGRIHPPAALLNAA
ncbi:MAG: Transposase [uncultured Chloroflexia bacterium]|uniref:Transposase n=1 Tax=uncultured Chloroflexia bacterium TaxID=1672391 RepID=A0A6J4NQJ1_9CHLR|nr:MAG: Transposase [uncultured Chloroflexia bacterium]